MELLDSKRIIQEIQEEVKDFQEQKVHFTDISAGNEPLKLLSYDANAMNWSLRTLRSSANIPWYRNVGGGFGGAVKKFIRKMVTFLVAPIAEEQTRYNACLEHTIEQLYSMVLEQQQRIDALEGKNKE